MLFLHTTPFTFLNESEKKKPLQNLARTLPTYPSSPSARDRIKTEPFATDSFQNLFFPLLLFLSLSPPPPTPPSPTIPPPSNPNTITLISHNFKRTRFLALHAPALRIPSDLVRYIGIDPPAHVTPPNVLERAEEENGARWWRADLYGLGEVLGGKRVRRGWDGGVGVRRWIEGLVGGGGLIGGETGEIGEEYWEGVRRLLEWRGGESGVEIYPGSLPWD